MQKLVLPRSHWRLGLRSAAIAQQKDARSCLVFAVHNWKQTAPQGIMVGRNGLWPGPLSLAVIFIVPAVGPSAEMTLGCFPVT